MSVSAKNKPFLKTRIQFHINIIYNILFKTNKIKIKTTNLCTDSSIIVVLVVEVVGLTSKKYGSLVPLL